MTRMIRQSMTATAQPHEALVEIAVHKHIVVLVPVRDLLGGIPQPPDDDFA